MSKKSNSSAASGGIGLGGVIFAVFLVLKLAEVGAVTTWSWWWVTSPLWIPFVVIFGGILAFVLLRVLVIGIGWVARRRNMKSMLDDD